MTSLLGDGYDSSSSSDGEAAASAPAPTAKTPIQAAPEVSIEDSSELSLMLANPTSTGTSTALAYNLTYDALSRPAQGPANPFKQASAKAPKRKNVLTGTAEETSISESTFRTQHRTFQSLGYSQDPGQAGAFVGNQAAVAQYGGRDAVELRHTKHDSDAIRAKRQKKGDTGIVDGDGAYVGPWAKYQSDDVAYEHAQAAVDAELASDEEWVEEGVVPAPLPAPAKTSTAYIDHASLAESTEFVGPQERLRDYQGRTYMHVPQDLDIDLHKEPGSVQNYAPKKLIHTYKYHAKAITALRFIPRSSHLLLSAAADAKLCLWDAYHERALLRTFSGHSKAITDTVFSPAGTSFLSASFDRYMKLWDTETGACISRFTTGKTPHCLAFHPSKSPHEFIAGTADKKIVQFDTRTGDLVQEYDHHLGPINTLVFVDDGRRFMSTSDDKSLRAWEYGIPVPIKFIADPEMFALTRACAHPSGKYVAYQSGDNQIVVFAAGDKFRQNRKKAFRGMNTAGLAVDVAISPDGNLVASGDSGGYACFWDWKTGKMLHKFLATEGKLGGRTDTRIGEPVTNLAWNEQETSKLVTGGRDGLIRYWD
ncbi:hypothetical protein DV737_g1819, partial [Chaetothyriales sp. CBS 132003]